MKNFNRRDMLATIAATAMGTSGQLLAQTAKPAAVPKAKASVRLGQKLNFVIPANAGGGWDQTGKALGTALIASGAVDDITYENVGGKGGTLGLVHYAKNYANDPNALLMGGMVMVGAVALQKPAVDMSSVRPVARLTSDYLVVVVAGDSPIRKVKDLADRMRTNIKEVPIAGGSAGGVDHMFAGVFARGSKAKPEDLVYLPFAGGTEVVDAVLTGKAVAGISGYSEFSAELASGKLRAIGVSAKQAIFGIPSIRDQGVNVDMANWRGVFTGQNVAAARQAEMIVAVQQATQHESWQKTLKQNRWESSWLSGPAFSGFIDFDMTTARVMVHLLKLKA